VIEQLDLVLLMSVNPGFGGQSFIESTLPKLEKARRLVDAAMKNSGREIWLEVDGGVKRDNARRVAEAGADTMVAGSAVFTGARNTAAYAEAIAAIRDEALAGQRQLARETA
jgi:ribulose-phosphate 3-epimerase